MVARFALVDGYWLIVDGCPLTTDNRQPTTINHQPSTNNRQTACKFPRPGAKNIGRFANLPRDNDAALKRARPEAPLAAARRERIQGRGARRPASAAPFAGMIRFFEQNQH
jgi:hypothetical protein